MRHRLSNYFDLCVQFLLTSALVRIRTRNRPLSGMHQRSGFLLKLVAAADAGDVAFAGSTFHAEKDLTVGALEVFIVLAVLHAFDELAGLQLPVRGQVDVLPVFLNTFGIVPGQHTENGRAIEDEAEKGEQADAGEAAQKGNHKTGQQGEHAQVIGAMATLHENS